MLRFLATFIVLSLLAGQAFAQTARRPTAPTIEQLAAYPQMASFTVSPDGRHIAGIQSRGEDRVILVWRTEALNAPPTVLRATAMKIQAVQFVKNDTLAVSLWQPYDFRGERVISTFISRLYFTDLEGRNWREPLPLPTARSEEAQREQAITNPTVLDILPNDPDNIIVVNNVGANSGDVYRVNVHTNQSERIQRRDDRVGGYVTDLQGNLRARIRTGFEGGRPYIATEIRAPNGGWQEHFRSLARDRDVIEIIGFTRDPNVALLRTNVGRDKAVIVEYDIGARQQREILFQHRFFEASDVIVDRHNGPNFGEVSGLVYDGPRGNDTRWVAPRYQQIDQQIRTALQIRPVPTSLVDPANGERVTANYDSRLYWDLVSASADLSTVIIAVEGPNRPRVFHLLRNNQLTQLAETYPQLDVAALGTSTWTNYTARDGLSIPAILTTPSTELCGPGPYRAVIHPHGGPWARDNLRFDYSMWVPLMASRCMAVLQPQYRGSFGYSRRLWRAGDAQWGLTMQDDLDDGARWLIQQGVAREGHIAVFGFSYGGYAAMAAAVRPNGLYRCAIAGAGVSNLHRIFQNFYENAYFRDSQAPTIDGLSPVEQAQNIQIPIMVYHGLRDQTVPVEQSQWFVAAARRSSQPVVYTEIADYAHGPAWTRQIMAAQLRGIETYFATGCGQGGL